MNVGSRHGGRWFCVSPSLSSSSFRSCCPVDTPFTLMSSTNKKAADLKRAVAHSPGQQRCYRPVVGPKAHTGGAFCFLQVPCQPRQKGIICCFYKYLRNKASREFLPRAAIRCSH